MDENQLYMTRITTTTLIGVMLDKFPSDRGNCFSILATDDKQYRIVNFHYENIKMVIELGIEIPIKIQILGNGMAIIHDERIPDEWYNNKFCEVCCPERLLPYPQILTHQRQIARGERNVGNEIISIDFSKSPKLPKEDQKDIIYAKYGVKMKARSVIPIKNFKLVPAEDINVIVGDDLRKDILSALIENFNKSSASE